MTFRRGVLIALSALALAGCGKNYGDFVGSWNVNSTRTYTVGGSTSSETGSGTVSVTQGTTADLIFNLDPILKGCSLQAMINSSTTFVVNQGSCQFDNACGGKTTLTVTGNGTVTAKVMNSTLAGQLSGNCSNGSSASGTFTWTITGNKL